MAQKQTSQVKWLQTSTLQLSRVHFFLVLAYALSIIVFDSWNLIPPDALLQRWGIGTMMLAGLAVIWYAARSKSMNASYYSFLVYAMIGLDIALAGISVYTQRGMASRAVMLFAVPIIVSAILISRRALFATAALCTATYAFSAIRYFVVHPGEGYKVELYGEVGFYCAVFFILAALLAVIIRKRP